MKRQAEIPGTERPNSIDELDALSEQFKAASKRRKHAQDAELEKRELLTECMRKHKLTTYENTDAGLVVTFSTKEAVKVIDAADVEAVDEGETNELPVEAHRKLEPKATKKSTPEA